MSCGVSFNIDNLLFGSDYRNYMYRKINNYRLRTFFNNIKNKIKIYLILYKKII